MDVATGVSIESYFEQQLADALSLEGVRLERDTELYLVELLAARGRGEVEQRSLVELVEAGLEQTGAPRYRTLRALGDETLWTMGLFSPRRSAMSSSYAVLVGKNAYREAARVARRGHGASASTLETLSTQFRALLGVLGRLRLSSSLASPENAEQLLRQLVAQGRLGRERLAWLWRPQR